ncbi:TPA: IS1 family transposase, partial [Raoultella ornithinolytica]
MKTSVINGSEVSRLSVAIQSTAGHQRYLCSHCRK